MRRSGIVMVFAAGLLVGVVTARGSQPRTPPRQAHAPFADRILVTQPDPASPNGRTSHFLNVRHIDDRPAQSADQCPANVWLVTLIQDPDEDDQQCVTYEVVE